MKKQTVCSGLELKAGIWKVQMNPLSYDHLLEVKTYAMDSLNGPLMLAKN